jgi:hypothetical protein
VLAMQTAFAILILPVELTVPVMQIVLATMIVLIEEIKWI